MHDMNMFMYIFKINIDFYFPHWLYFLIGTKEKPTTLFSM